MVDSLNTCLEELKKNYEERNFEIITTYLKTLTPFIQMLKQDIQKFPELLNQISRLIQLNQCPANSIIIQNGEKGNSFYIMLEGKAAVLALKQEQHELTEEEYIFHLFKLRRNNEIEQLKQCIQLNNLIYPMGDENFDTFIKNVAFQKGNGTMYQDNQNIIEKAKETLKFLKAQSFKVTRQNRELTIDQYIANNKVDKYNYIKFGDESKKKKVIIPNYEVINHVEQGQSFGDIALDSTNNKRTATLISMENCSFGVINKNDYESCIKNVNEKNRKKFFTVIYSYNIFQYISRYVFEKKYFNFFKYKKCERNEILVKENEKNENMFFIINGEFELSTSRNIVEVNNLIIQYKKTLINFQKQSKNNYLKKLVEKEDNKKIKAILNYEEEEKENEDLILNHNFKTKEQNKILYTKNNIKFGIARNREIIGLSDLIQDSTGVGLVNCKCLSFIGGAYTIKIHLYNKIQKNEETIKELSAEWQTKKLLFLIERLNKHKENVYSTIKKNDDETAKYYLNHQLKYDDLNRKNRLYTLENNSTFTKNAFNVVDLQPQRKNNKNKKKTFLSYNYDPISRKKISLKHCIVDTKPIEEIKSYQDKMSINKSSNELFLKRYKRDIFSRNLYDNLFNSYLCTSVQKEKETIETNSSGTSSRNQKKQKLSYIQYKTESDNMNLVDCLVLDKFNSCYKQVFNNLKSKY